MGAELASISKQNTFTEHSPHAGIALSSLNVLTLKQLGRVLPSLAEKGAEGP